MPLKDDGQQSLLYCAVDLIGAFLWANSGSVVLRLYRVGMEDGGIVPTEGVSIGPRKVVAVGGLKNHKAWKAGYIGHGEGSCHAR